MKVCSYLFYSEFHINIFSRDGKNKQNKYMDYWKKDWTFFIDPRIYA